MSRNGCDGLNNLKKNQSVMSNIVGLQNPLDYQDNARYINASLRV